jgi:2-polyprenyl-6-methoxyphenol hydroxylase-like FAD-dependent oxidoreductase
MSDHRNIPLEKARRKKKFGSWRKSCRLRARQRSAMVAAGSKYVTHAAGFTAAWLKALPLAQPVLEHMRTWDAVLINEVVEVHCTRFSAGRMAVLGDAAHGMAPNLGQGANSALVDAAVLVSELSGAGPLSAALQRYDRRRRPSVTRVQRQASHVMRLAHVRRPRLASYAIACWRLCRGWLATTPPVPFSRKTGVFAGDYSRDSVDLISSAGEPTSNASEWRSRG